MNAVEKLQAAIDKLEALRGSDREEWVAIGGDDEYLRLGDIATAGPEGGRYVIAEHARHDAELIVTLHRTIDAQLAILRMALHYVAGGFRYGFVEEQGINLATAILGGS